MVLSPEAPVGEHLSTNWKDQNSRARCGLNCTDTFIPRFSHQKLAVSAVGFSSNVGFSGAAKSSTFKGVDRLWNVGLSEAETSLRAPSGLSRADTQTTSGPEVLWFERLSIPQVVTQGDLEGMTTSNQQAREEGSFSLGQSEPLIGAYDIWGGTAIANVPLVPETLFPEGSGPMGLAVPWDIAQVPSAQPTPFPSDPAAGSWMMIWVPAGIPGETAAQTPANFNGVPYSPQGAAAATPGQVMIPWGAPGPGYAIPVVPQGGQPFLYGAYPAPVPAGFPQQPYPAQYPIFPTAQGYPGAVVPASMPGVPPSIGTGQSLPVPAVPNGVSQAPAPLTPPSVFQVPVVGPGGAMSPAVLPANSPGFPGAAQMPVSPVPTAPIPPATQAPPLSQPVAPPPIDVSTSRKPITQPRLEAQGLAIVQEGEFSSRARLNGTAFLTPNLLVGGTVDFVNGPDLTNDDGLQITELYVGGSLPSTPGLRFRAGQLDLTSYFDRNSFAKDISRDFFSSTFQTNPALFAGANVTASRPAGLVQWAVNDDITLTASAFSSDSDISNFDLNGFAAEASVRTGNLIVRGTFLSSEDTDFQGTGERLEAYGINAEWFVPSLNLGFFGRYGTVDNTGTDFSDDAFSFGLNAFDVLMDNDRLGLAYGRNLEVSADEDTEPDVLEIFYDFELRPNLRAGFTFQQRNSLRESFAGFRIRSNFDILP